MTLLHDAAVQAFTGPWRNLWPILAVPTAAAAVRDACVREPARSRPMAWAHGVLVAVPGLLALALIAYALGDSLPPDKGLRPSAVWMIAPALGVALVAWMALRQLDRRAQVNRLFALSAPATGDLAALGRELGLRIRRLDAPQGACFVAGVLWPTAFVARDVEAALAPAELRAVLLHERAHVAARDTLWLEALAMLRDLRPVGGERALRTFLAGLERLADMAAARQCDATDLAAAIVRLQRGATRSRFALSVAEPSFLRWRLSLLLGSGAVPAERARTVLLGLAGVAALLGWPALQHELRWVFCPG